MENRDTNWYWASARYVLIQDEVETSTDLKERIVFLVRAADDAEAKTLAFEFALRKESSYVTAADSNAKWKLQGVERVQELFDADIVSGTDVFWEFIGADQIS